MPDSMKVLVVDDDVTLLDTLGERIRLRGFHVRTASTGGEAIALAREEAPQLAIVDHHLPDMDGLVVVEKLREIDSSTRTVLLTGHGSGKLQEASEALEASYFEKSDMASFWDFMKQVREDGGVFLYAPAGADGQISADAMEMFAAGQMDRRHNLLKASRMPRLIGETPAMQELRTNIAKVAALDCTVLIRGETGTGKELVAKAIHASSPRSGGRFLAVNCGSFNQELLSNELFGHEREAFTGANRVKKGVFEAASNGTIMLDEVGDTPLSMQVQLLRVLQEKAVIRVGGTEEVPVDVRVLAATNKSLSDAVSDGSFREDLFYRLNIFTLRIPPLRERRDDIAPLASFFLAKYNSEFGKRVERISPEFMARLMDYDFPGNVRELENIIERAVILCESNVLDDHLLPERFKAGSTAVKKSASGFITLAELEREYIKEVLKGTGGNKSEAARVLGISRACLWRKVKQIEGRDSVKK